MRNLILLSGFAAVLLVGCHQDKPKPAGFVGSWRTTTDAAKVDPKLSAVLAKQGMKTQNNVATFSFNADQTMSFAASEMPGQKPYKLTGVGTWSATDKMLTVTPMNMDLTGLSDKEMEQFRPQMKAKLNHKQSGAFEWKGPDEFVLTYPGALPQHFTRLPDK